MKRDIINQIIAQTLFVTHIQEVWKYRLTYHRGTYKYYEGLGDILPLPRIAETVLIDKASHLRRKP